jgi:hypothetical protein
MPRRASVETPIRDSGGWAWTEHQATVTAFLALSQYDRRAKVIGVACIVISKSERKKRAANLHKATEVCDGR